MRHPFRSVTRSIVTMRHLWLGVLLAASACGPSFEATTPPGFVELDEESERYQYRATNADGLVLAVRELDNEVDGGPEFWVKAVQNSMRERGGYALLGSAKVRSADGVDGTQLRFGHDEDSGKPHLYYVAVFVTNGKILLFEAGGTKELVTKHAATIDAAVRGFRTQ
jgi:hypothetical protein